MPARTARPFRPTSRWRSPTTARHFGLTTRSASATPLTEQRAEIDAVFKSAVDGTRYLLQVGDEVALDYAAAKVRNVKTGREVAIRRLPPTVEQIIEAGGIIPVIARRLAAEGILPPEPVPA